MQECRKKQKSVDFIIYICNWIRQENSEYCEIPENEAMLNDLVSCVVLDFILLYDLCNWNIWQTVFSLLLFRMLFGMLFPHAVCKENPCECGKSERIEKKQQQHNMPLKWSKYVKLDSMCFVFHNEINGRSSFPFRQLCFGEWFSVQIVWYAVCISVL